MVTSPYVVGVDPGGTTGVCLLDLSDGSAEVAQTSPGLVLPLVRSLLDGARLIAVEQFVVGPRAGRSSTPAAGRTARELIGALLGLGGDRVVLRSAAAVKPWATDRRLDAAGLRFRGMPHARDAARHALFAAVQDCGMPDPLSKRARA